MNMNIPAEKSFLLPGKNPARRLTGQNIRNRMALQSIRDLSRWIMLRFIRTENSLRQGEVVRRSLWKTGNTEGSGKCCSVLLRWF